MQRRCFHISRSFSRLYPNYRPSFCLRSAPECRIEIPWKRRESRFILSLQIVTEKFGAYQKNAWNTRFMGFCIKWTHFLCSGVYPTLLWFLNVWDCTEKMWFSEYVWTLKIRILKAKWHILFHGLVSAKLTHSTKSFYSNYKWCFPRCRLGRNTRCDQEVKWVFK